MMARYRCRSRTVRSGLGSLTAATSSKTSEMSWTDSPGRSTSLTRSKNSCNSRLDRSASANMSGVGVKVPASARVIELVSAATSRSMKLVKTLQ